MKLSTRGRYATRALLDLALHLDEAPVQLRDIARRQEISQAYLEHLVTPMIGAGILASTRGPKGGISLAKPLEDIHLDQVIELLEGTTAPAECVDNPDVCQRSGCCATRDVWEELRGAISDVLRSVTLRDLLEKQRSKETSVEAMYYI